MISSAKIMLRNFVERSIPTVLFARAPESSDSDDDDPPLLQMASERKAEKLQEIDSLELPADFLDCVINALGGHTRVAEMTGRKMRLEKTSPDSYVLVQRASQNNNLDSINGAWNVFSHVPNSGFSGGKAQIYERREIDWHCFRCWKHRNFASCRSKLCQQTASCSYYGGASMERR